MYPLTKQDILNILNYYNPIGIADKNRLDEYEPEAKMIFKKLSKTSSFKDIENIIYETFVEMFSLSIAKSKRQYFSNIAKDIWQKMI